MSEQEHTPLPWHVGSDFDSGESLVTAIYDSRCIYIASAVGDMEAITKDQRRANTTFIVQACNAHDTIARLLRRCYNQITEGELRDDIQKAMHDLLENKTPE